MGDQPIGALRAGSAERRLADTTYKVDGPLLYVTNYTAHYNDVTVYRARLRDPDPIATISDGIDTPAGDCTDSQGTLYVTNEPINGPGWVSEYPIGKTSPSETITVGVNTPAFCAIDAKDDLWVTNIASANVTEYKAGSKKPSMVITDGVPDPDGIAIDHRGNLYVSNGLGGGGSTINVVVYPPGKRSPSRTITDSVRSPVGIAVDSGGTLYVTNASENNIEKYRYGKSHPYQIITEAINGPFGVTVSKQGWLYVANNGNNVVLEFPPGSTEPSRRQISKGLYTPVSMAYFPHCSHEDRGLSPTVSSGIEEALGPHAKLARLGIRAARKLSDHEADNSSTQGYSAQN